MKSQLVTFSLLLLVSLSLGCTQQGTGSDGTSTQWTVQNNLGTRYGIFTMNIDGTAVTQVYGSSNKLTSALPSPDGTKIVFFEQTGGIEEISNSEIAMINADGTGYVKLTDNSWMDFQPMWSPDGDELLFISDGGKLAGTDIYVMDTDGEIIRQLTDTPGMSEADPDWKCGKIVFTRNGTVWIMGDDGSDEQQLTDPPGRGVDVGVQFRLGDYDPNLSPDCSKVSFERLVGSGKFVSGIYIGDYDIYVHEISTGTEQDISLNDLGDLLPEWSPDGTKLLFVHLSDVSADLYDIYMINADGTGRTKVTGDDPLNFVEDGCTWFGNKILFTAEFFE